MPDVPHLIKNLRVHILNQGVKFQFEGKSCSLNKSDFERLLDQDAALGELRRLYKIKYEMVLLSFDNKIVFSEDSTLIAMATKFSAYEQLSSCSVSQWRIPSSWLIERTWPTSSPQ